MAQKSNYSEVQKMDRAGTIKKIILIFALLLVIFVGLLVFRVFSSINEPKTTTTPETSADLTMVPTTTYYYDPQSEKTYDVGVNYIILADSDGYLKVSSTGEVTRVSSDGTYLNTVTDDEKNTALQIAANIIKNDNYASMALDGLNVEDSSSTKTETPVEKSPLDVLYSTVEAMGYNTDDFIRQVYLTGSTPNDVITLIDNGINSETIIKSIMAQKATTDSSTTGGETKTNTGITASVEKIGLVGGEETVLTTTDTTSSSSNYPSWLQTTDPTSSMSAVLESLSSLASGGSSSGTSTSSSTKTSWETTNKQEEKTQWLSEQQSTEVTANRLTRYDLVAGTTVPITIITGVNTDIPGQVVGQVRQDVYDSLTGTNVLIPKGSRVIASYNSSVSFGQKSIQIAWTQLITTDGYQFSLPGFNGTTPEGYAGVSDKVNNHFWAILGGAALGSLIDWGAAYAKTESSKLVSGGTLSELVSALSGSTLDTASTIGQKYTNLWMNLQPTITIRTGTQTQLLVNQTISLKRPTNSYVTNAF